MAQNPLVSVIVTTYNRELFIAEALESIRTQNYQPLELVVIDDGSTDRTAEIVRSQFPEAIYRHHPNQGQPFSMNTGVSLASGDLITFLDSDDLWAPGTLSKRVDFMMEHPALDILGGNVRNFVDRSISEEDQRKFKHLDEAIPGYVPSALLFRKSVLGLVGPFSSQWQVGFFMDWLARLQALELKIGMQPEVVVLRRIHRNNKGRVLREFTIERVAVLKSILDQRRGHKPSPDPANESQR